ncbi:hypothetical protein M0R45_008134 [Rubus argutus]|uniref:Wall-associated receptor kinase galacturonan-binding domain-containing protein n=1 Tax=Rubus argutus TaxID=59490 RepID=A0AAW1Y0U0_RUBAR
MHLYLLPNIFFLGYLNCRQSFQCSNIESIGSPFWGSTRPDYCGHPEFKLNCSGDAPSISIQDQQYRVLSINHTYSSFKIARVEYRNNVCLTSLTNSTATDDSSSSHVFEYASGVQTHALQHIPLPPQLINPFNCTTNSITNLLVRAPVVSADTIPLQLDSFAIARMDLILITVEV